MFQITNSKGFQIKFANGWTASVQFGLENDCYNKWYPDPFEKKTGDIKCANAEFTVIGDSVEASYGTQTPDDVLKLLNEVAQRPNLIPEQDICGYCGTVSLVDSHHH